MHITFDLLCNSHLWITGNYFFPNTLFYINYSTRILNWINFLSGKLYLMNTYINIIVNSYVSIPNVYFCIFYILASYKSNKNNQPHFDEPTHIPIYIRNGIYISIRILHRPNNIFIILFQLTLNFMAILIY